MASLSKGVRIRSGRGGGRAYLAKLNRADQLAKADASAFQEHLKGKHAACVSLFNAYHCWQLFPRKPDTYFLGRTPTTTTFQSMTRLGEKRGRGLRMAMVGQ